MSFISFLNPETDEIRNFVSAAAEVNRLSAEIDWYVRNGVRTSVKSDRRFRAFVRQLAEAEADEAEARAIVREAERASLRGVKRFFYNLIVR